jgi:uncharacterized membrane protein YfcA
MLDGIVLAFFLFATFIGAVTSGLAGFALGLVVSGIWLHFLTPLQTATLVVGYGLLSQAYGIWKLRHALDWRKFMPFVIGGVAGVPVGVLLIGMINPDHLRTGVGVLLLLYSAYSLARPSIKPVHAPASVHVGVGVLNGVIGGLTGLSAIVVTLWCQVQSWSKDVQRAVFQPANFGAFVLTAVGYAFAGAITVEVTKLYLLGLPVFLIGLWIGMKLYGRLDEAGFRRIVLVLLFISGLSLVGRPLLAIGG